MATPWKNVRDRVGLISGIRDAIQRGVINFVDHGEGLLVGMYVQSISKNTFRPSIITLRRITGKLYDRNRSMYLTNDGCSTYILTVQEQDKIIFSREDDDNRYIAGEDPRLPVDLYDLVSTGKLRYRG